MPPIFTIPRQPHIGIEYFKKNIVGEGADGHSLVKLICVGQVSNRRKGCIWISPELQLTLTLFGQ